MPRILPQSPPQLSPYSSSNRTAPILDLEFQLPPTTLHICLQQAVKLCWYAAKEPNLHCLSFQSQDLQLKSSKAKDSGMKTCTSWGQQQSKEKEYKARANIILHLDTFSHFIIDVPSFSSNHNNIFVNSLPNTSPPAFGKKWDHHSSAKHAGDTGTFPPWSKSQTPQNKTKKDPDARQTEI